MLLINTVPLDCINYAAKTYHLPPALILAVLKTEGGYKGLAKKNTNGSYDYGPMQVNSIWLLKLANYGYTQDDLQFNPCKNVLAASWILSKKIVQAQTLQKGIGNYHSYRFSYNLSYYRKITSNYIKTNHFLKAD